MPTELELPPSIARASRAISWVCLVAAAAWPLLAVLALAPMQPAELLERAGLPGIASERWGGGLYASWQQAVVVFLLALPAALAGMSLARLARGFRALGRGRAELPAACGALRGFAAWTLAATLMGMVAGPLASLVLTLQHPPGQRGMAVALSSGHVQGLLVAALVWMFAHLLARACTVADENAQFV